MEETVDIGPKLEELSADGAECGDLRSIFEGERDAALIGGIVGVRDSSRDEVAEHVGDVGLIFAIVAQADHGRYGCVEKTAAERARTEPEVSGVLVKNDRKQAVADEGAVDVIGVVGADALEVAARAPAVAGVGTYEFAVAAANDKGIADIEGVDGGVAGELPLLTGGERDRFAAHDDLKLRHDSEQALLLFRLEIALRLLPLLFPRVLGFWCGLGTYRRLG